jgi:signal transduction histidine kinase
MKFKYKLFISFTSLSIFLVSLLVYIFYRIVAYDTVLQYEGQYKRLESIVSETFLTLEKLSENSALISIKSIRNIYASTKLPDDNELKKIAVKMGVNQIAATDLSGNFIRDTVTPKNDRTKKLFGFCSDYEQMVKPGAEKVFVTPIIPSFLNKGPFKFIMISDPYHHGILEVGVSLEFITKLLSYVIKSDENIVSIGFYTPTGSSLGTINRVGKFIGENVSIINERTLEDTISSHENYILHKSIYFDNENCCECRIKNISNQDGRYFYLLQLEISTREVTKRLADIKQLSIITLLVLVLISIILSNYLSNYLVKRLKYLNKTINNIINHKHLNIDMKVSGNDEISIISKNFNKMLSWLKKYEDEKLYLERIKTVSLVAKQVAHDIRSPLSALTMVASTLKDVPEEKRILIRNATQRINDIANDLLQRSKVVNAEQSVSAESRKITIDINNVESPSKITQDQAYNQRQPSTEFIPALIDILVSEKRMQFREHSSLEIQTDFKQSFGSFAKINSVVLKRVISNLINNSVEAFDNFNGVITVGVRKGPDSKNPNHADSRAEIEIFVNDNGKGIPADIIEKLGAQNLSYGKESSKQSGTGLGLLHAKQSIESMGGVLKIESTLGQGTTVRLILPLADSPEWFANKIDLTNKTKLVSLDDDISIHQIWSGRLQSLGIKNIEHIKFQSTENFEKYVYANLNDMKNTVFLIDFEMLNQSKTGLDLIEELGIEKHAILVTSRYEEKDVQERSARLRLQILPKSLAGFVPFGI